MKVNTSQTLVIFSLYLLLLILNLTTISCNESVASNSPNQNLVYAPGSKVLALLDDWNLVETHSLFWDQIRSKF